MTKIIFKYTAVLLLLSGFSNLFTEILAFLNFESQVVLKSINFVGAAMALWGMLGLYILKYSELKRLGLVLFSIFSFGLVGIVSFLFTDAFVFTQLDSAKVTDLTNGTTGLAIFASIILYVLGLVSFGIYSAVKKVYPKIPILIYSLGSIITPFALVLPYFFVSIVEIAGSASVLYLGYWFWNEVEDRFTKHSKTSQIG